MDARTRRMKGLLLLSALACLLMLGRAHAQPAQSPQPAPQAVHVGVQVTPPFVLKEDDGYSGMAVELWQKIAADLGITSKYEEFPNYTDLVEAVAKGKVQIAVANLAITKSRVQIVDFSQPWFDAGLRVMVHSNPGINIMEVIRDLRDAGHLTNFAWIAFGIIIAMALMTIIDRMLDPESDRRWREVLAENFYHAISLATRGESSRKKLFGWIGRIGQGLWLLFSVVVIAYVASSITSVMTASHIVNRINSVADLQGKVVGVLSGSVAEEYMKASKANTMPFNHISEAADALVRREISAIVGDRPILEYFTHTHPNLPLDVVGNTFHPDKYGFALPTGSTLTRPVSLSIIGLQESGELERLRAKYFGFNP